VYEPDLAMRDVIAALDVARGRQEQPLDSAGWPARFLPEAAYGNRHTEGERLAYALFPAAAFRTGLRPDILTDN
jgi:hypothetical protein